MFFHDLPAIKRNIKFTENVNVKVDVKASAQCSWNCMWTIMTCESLWCERDMLDVDFRDLCVAWEGEIG
jgi:hypothetical protein